MVLRLTMILETKQGDGLDQWEDVAVGLELDSSTALCAEWYGWAVTAQFHHRNMCFFHGQFGFSSGWGQPVMDKSILQKAILVWLDQANKCIEMPDM